MNDDHSGSGGAHLEGRFRALTIIWIALMAGVVTFTGVIYALTTMDLVELGGGAVSPARYQTGRIIALALQEAAALFVGVLSLLADSGTWALIVGAAAVWGMILARPRREDLGHLLR